MCGAVGSRGELPATRARRLAVSTSGSDGVGAAESASRWLAVSTSARDRGEEGPPAAPALSLP
jgi:hypothetical protein